MDSVQSPWFSRKPHGLTGLVGRSECFADMVRRLGVIAETDVSVLICGETGTGKELAARAIHDASRRSDRPWVPLNCSALPEALVENELFGHSRGAFTGATAPTPGLVQEADGGTLFLDEIDSLSLGAQSKLLRFLQDRTFRPVGHVKSLRADVRIVAATNADLGERIRQRSFRQDLYYRIQEVTVNVPPLRERKADILMLAKHFLEECSRKWQKKLAGLSPNAAQALEAYGWPGNVRELQAAVNKAVLFSAKEELDPEDFGLMNPGNVGSGSQSPGKRLTFTQAKARAIIEFERTYLEEVLRENQGNLSAAARQSGKDRRSFQRLLTKYGLHREDY